MSIADEIESSLNRLVQNFSPNHGSIKSLTRLSGGASQEIWAFALDIGEKIAPRYILRRAPGGKRPDVTDHTLPLSTEAKLLQAAGKAGIAVPHVAYICSPEDGLGDAFIMTFVAGETIARKIQRDEAYEAARSGFAAACGRALAAIHQIDPASLPDLPVSGGLDQIVRYEEIYLNMSLPRPVFALAFQWLKNNAPASGQQRLVHGDFRLGNLMVNQSGLCAVLDWELAHLGDPREDIGWICVNSWRFGQREKRVGGLGDLEVFLNAYKDAGGQAFTPSEIDWWEMLGTLKWGIMCMIMYQTYKTGADVSVEKAAIGRRVSETEIDLILLLERLTDHV